MLTCSGDDVPCVANELSGVICTNCVPRTDGATVGRNPLSEWLLVQREKALKLQGI